LAQAEDQGNQQEGEQELMEIEEDQKMRMENVAV